jgi:hypothetical protein
MQGRAFLDVAREAVQGSTEAHWRTAAVNAYYALMLECRDVLARWGHRPPPRQNVHPCVRLKFVYARDSDVKNIGIALEDLVQLRNKAHYDLSSLAEFASSTRADRAIQKAAAALSVLDAIEGDPARRAAAIASLPPSRRTSAKLPERGRSLGSELRQGT